MNRRLYPENEGIFLAEATEAEISLLKHITTRCVTSILPQSNFYEVHDSRLYLTACSLSALPAGVGTR